MIRFAYSFMFVPYPHTANKYTFYVTVTVWKNEKAIKSINVLERVVENVEETTEMSKTPAFAVAMVDLAYSELSFKLAELTAKYNTETNARPGEASVPS